MKEEILLSYLNGTLSYKDKIRVEEWILADKDNENLLNKLYDAYTISNSLTTLQSVDVDRAYEQFLECRAEKRRSKIFTRLPIRSIVAAAVVVVAVVFSISGVSGYIEKLEKPIIVSTGIGEKVELQLPDGTKVWVNSCTEFKYQPSILKSERRVAISGEAYFEVKKDTDNPFFVDCDNMQIKVLGTKFNVQSNEDDDFLKTTLLDGAVRVSSKHMDRDVTMTPNQQLIIHKITGSSRLVNLETVKSCRLWTEGRIIFDEISFHEAAMVIKRQFGVDVVFDDDKVRDLKFVCSFDSNSTILEVMSLLELTNKFTYKKYGNTIYAKVID